MFRAMKNQNYMEDLQTGNDFGLGKYAPIIMTPLIMIVSFTWDLIFKHGLNFGVTALSSFAIALLIYVANNIWFPKWFGKKKTS
jgi:hypothetical protein